MWRSGKENIMQIRLMLLATAAALAIAPAAHAQQEADPLMPPAPAEQAPVDQVPVDQVPMEGAPADIAPSDPATSQAPMTPDPDAADDAIGDVVVEPTPVPPPAEALIEAQGPNEMRAESLIGASVFNAEGEEVGKIKDILFDTSGGATGVVLSVGGVMGIGAKEVGLTWQEVDLRPQPELVRIQYSKEQLEAAPTFKSHEAQEAEATQQLDEPVLPPAGGIDTDPTAPAPTE